MIKMTIEECRSCNGYGGKYGQTCNQCNGIGAITVHTGVPNGRVEFTPYRPQCKREIKRV